MSDEIVARVSKFVRQTLDLHLPVVLGLMADEGVSPPEQSRRASQLVKVLRSVDVESNLITQGRPVALALNELDEGGHQLVINAQLVSRVDDEALASAMAEPVAQILGISSVVVGLILREKDVAQLRGLAGKLSSQAGGETISIMAVEELLRWRLENFEERLYSLVEGLGGWLEAAGTPKDEFISTLAETARTWPEWPQVCDSSYLKIWRDEVGAELGRSDWAEHSDILLEMVWESMGVSLASALRQAAQTVRSLNTEGAPEKLLEVLADAMGLGSDEGQRSIQSWPGLEGLAEAWQALIAEEDRLIGAGRRRKEAPPISVFQPPRQTMGFREPRNLPWDLPLLGWTLREQEALGDLLQGMEKSLIAQRAEFRRGRVTELVATEANSLSASENQRQWAIDLPNRWPSLSEGFSRAVNKAFGAVSQKYLEAFEALDVPAQRQAMTFVNGTYSGYLVESKSVWSRRLRGGDGKPKSERFRYFLTTMARAVEWPIFIDPFQEGIDSPALAQMPRFTVLAVWYEEAEFAPVWIPVETIGEAMGQAPIRIRNIAVEADGESLRWLGDHEVKKGELRTLKTESLLRSLDQGTLRIAIRRA